MSKPESRGSHAFLLAAFLNAFIDLGHKIILQNTAFKMYGGTTQVVLTALINAMMLLPFILLVMPAGLMSDRYPRIAVMRRCGQAAVACCALIMVFYYLGWFLPALLMTLALAIQATLYSPAKYGFIREAYGRQQLGEINGLLSALSIAGILFGTFAFSLVFESSYPAAPESAGAVLQGVAIAGWLLLAGSVVELWALYQIPEPAPEPLSGSAIPGSQNEPPLTEPAAGGDLANWNTWFSTAAQQAQWQQLLQHRAIRLSATGLAVFWAVGQVMLATFPSYIEDAAGISNTIVVQGLLACAGIGIAFGSVYAGRYSRNYIETGLLPLGALGVALGLLLLTTVESVFALGVLILLIGFAGGVFIVPLNALIQFFARPESLGKTLAANNWLQNVAMLGFLLLTMLFALLGLSSRALLQLVGLVALVGSAYTLYELPQSLTRFVLGRIVSTHYRIKVQGMRHIPAEGGVLLLGNHVSWIDWAVVQIACPRPVRFVMISTIYELWYLKWFFQKFGCIPIHHGASSRSALEAVSAALQNGDVVCMFPEGTISRNGQLAEFRRGYERACAEVDASVVIVPFFLRGLWGTMFSRSSPRLKRRPNLGREVVVDFGAPLPGKTPAEVLKQKVVELAHGSWEEYADGLPTIGDHWIDTCSKRGNPLVLIDTLGTELRAKQALTGTIVMARRMRKLSPEQNVGLLLPSSTGSALGNLALMLLGKTAVNLNFTASSEALLSSVLQAEIKTIYTSSRFVERLKTRGVDLRPLQNHAKLVMLEDLRATATPKEKLLTLLACFALPPSMLKLLFARKHSIHDTAVILFSSGSEGIPKGVTLTHRNLLTNVKQITELLNMGDDDVMLANLPPFHAFGLTVTHFMPLMEQVPVVCHADPTDVYGAAQAIAKHQITTMFGTCSFYRLYNRNSKIHPLMMQSLRLCIAGAEKLQDEVRKEFKLKFNKDILEGYGATEVAPVASVNVPDQISPGNWRVQVSWKPGSVGMPLPGTSFRIVEPHSFESLPIGEAGMVLVSGAQVMPGYLKNEQKTQEVLRTIDGKRWYVTGDKGYLDTDGFLYIIDRYSRFAKISGEMVGLGAVETAIKAVVDQADFEVVVVNLPDERKGERLIALVTLELDAANLREKLLAGGLTTLALPAQYVKVDAVPKLGSGKTDFAAARTLAISRVTLA